MEASAGTGISATGLLAPRREGFLEAHLNHETRANLRQEIDHLELDMSRELDL